MLDFRKVLLALSVAGLGLVGTASAQVTCSGVPAVTPITVRAEGLTEQLPQLTIGTCTGNTNTTNVSFTLTTNAPITNLLLTGTTTNATDAIATLTTTGAPVTVAGTLVNANTLQFLFGGLPVGGVGVTNIVVNNVRVNANSVPVGATITTTLASGNGLFLTAPTSPTAAFTNTSLAATTFTGYLNIAVCASTTSAVNVVGTVKLSENFATAFSTSAQETALETAGGANGLANNPTGTAGAIIGTRIALTFGNLASGVNYYLPASVTSGGLVLKLVPAANSQDTALLAGGNIGVAGPPASPGYPGGQVAGVYQITPTSGSATVYYAVTTDSGAIDATGGAAVQPAALDGTQINLYEILQAGTTTGVTAAPTVAASIVGNTSTGYPQFAAASPTAVAAKNPAGVTGSQGILTSCNTTMVFPYVLATGGYDTGIALTNASNGSSIGTNTVTKQDGSCATTLYGSATLNGAALTPFTIASVNVPAGTVNAFTLSGALSALTTPPAGFAGYAITVCTFGGAHGFAQISDSTGPNPGKGLSEGYLAVILQDTFAGAPFTQNATF